MKKDISVEIVAKRILFIRGLKVMLDSDLAEIYGVKTKELNQAVQRNKDRFPTDFMIRLTSEELRNLRFQIGPSSLHGGRRYLPYAFTQEGTAMLSGILRSAVAVRANIAIMRAFVKVREILETHKDLARRLEALERKFNSHDYQLKAVFDAIKQMMNEPAKPKRRIGFLEEPKAVYKAR
jgi:hypothetical protein